MSLMAGNPVEKPKELPTIATTAVNQRRGLAIVIGVGPGIGASVARRFAKEGLLVCMIARTDQFMNGIKEQIESAGGKCFIVLADASNTASLTAGLDQALSHISPSFPLQSVIYNAAARIESPFLKLQEKHLETSYKLNQLAPWTICQRTLPIMVKQGFGSVLVTGATASLRGNAGFTCFGSTKSALRAFCQSLAKEFGAQGIHVAHFIIDGGVANSRVRHVRKDIPWDKMGASMDPDAIAEMYWVTHVQHFSSWTFEFDLRPFSERF